MKIKPTRAAKASSVNLVKYLKENNIYTKAVNTKNANLTIADPSTATIIMQKSADQMPIQSLRVR